MKSNPSRSLIPMAYPKKHAKEETEIGKDKTDMHVKEKIFRDEMPLRIQFDWPSGIKRFCQDMAAIVGKASGALISRAFASSGDDTRGDIGK